MSRRPGGWRSQPSSEGFTCDDPRWMLMAGYDRLGSFLVKSLKRIQAHSGLAPA
jgi:hypothetical protein